LRTAPVKHDKRSAAKGALKMQDLKMKDQISGPENAGIENAGLFRIAASLCG